MKLPNRSAASFRIAPVTLGVGVQREARAVVPQDVRYRLDVHSLLDGQSCERVSEAMERQAFGDPRLPQQGLVQPSDTVRAIHPPRHRRGEHIGVGWVLFVLLHQQVHRFLRQTDRPNRVGGFRLGDPHLTLQTPC